MRLFLDVTRLRQRGRRSTPSGIDRVEYAYLDYVLDHADFADAQFVVFQGFVEGLIKHERAATLRGAVAASWRLDRTTLDDEVHRALKAELESPPQLAATAATRIEAPPASSRWAEIGALAPREMLRARARLVRRLHVAGPDAIYLHTSHAQLDREALPRWLEGARVQPAFFLHDVIPIDTPEYCRPGEDARHKLRLAAIARHGRLVLVNSQSTADAARARIAAEGWRTPPFAVVPLGVETCFRTRAALDPPRAAHPYVVVVGTIEPRKNLTFLLALWRRLVERHGVRAPRLVIVGRRGWENESVLDYLERSHRIAPFVIEASDISDAGLANVMAGAKLVLAPSLSEGFSLPVAEALTLGAPVAASDIAVHHEVGQGLARLIDPLDGPGWARAIEEACGLAEDGATFPPPARPYRSLTWREHVETAFGHLQTHLLRDRPSRARAAPATAQ